MLSHVPYGGQQLIYYTSALFKHAYMQQIFIFTQFQDIFKNNKTKKKAVPPETFFFLGFEEFAEFH